MKLELGNYEELARIGIHQFWSGRSSALSVSEPGAQGGERQGVLSGKNLDGFLALIEELVRNNGLPEAIVHSSSRPNLTLPGFYRPTKLWDVLILQDDKLVAAIELKSQVGPSFGNNFNNRTEEAIGTAHDLWTAIRENVLGDQPRPFLGWLILVEDCQKSRTPVRERSPHFPVFPEFQGSSYLQRYDILCQKMMREQLYTQASVLASPREAIETGAFEDMSKSTSLKSFVAGLAAHVAAWATVNA
ncbi:PaeR7I family type II restriction endonuclease [Aquilutibacter rugosus]|uniref:PaeR7I family type II restriction endonuclease n=1 Tax=Aquilutibacter rugosus TaxID=3115820 RepID=UPI002F41052F